VFVEINLKCAGIEMKEKKRVLDLEKKRVLDLDNRRTRTILFLIFGHLTEKEFGFT